MSKVDTNTLQWVKSEIDETLKQAQISLEAYVEDTADESQIRFCINYLHQVHGTLQMVELHGAALAIEEMEKLAKAIFEDKVNNKDDAYETLMHGILQVPDYLEHLLAGNPDMPVVLLPLLNDIRAARNEALLSEGALFTPDLSVAAPAVDLSVENKGDGLSALARKLRHNYHLGLLSWFQNKNPKAGLQKISDVISELTKAAESDEARRVFWIANGLVESLKDDGVDNSVAVKMLLGHVDRQIKKIIDDGEFALDEAPPEELEKNLLYYVATSTTSGDFTKEIKDAFNLKDIMPDTQTVEQARADLTAPNAALMETVSAVIIEDINKVKDNLDVFVRADDKDMSVLEEVNTSLTQMADTLAMLNLGVQREAVLKQAEVVNNIVNGKLAADEAELMNVAAAMIAVENSLSKASTAKAASSVVVDEGIDVDDVALAQLQGAEQQKLMETVLDEAKVNLTKVKEALTVFSQNNDERDQLKPVPAFLEQIQGSLMILSLEPAANLLALTNNYIRKNLINETIAPSLDDMNHLADAISSLEYYMESLMGSWGQPEAILNVAEQSLQSLGINTDEIAEAEEVPDDTEVVEPEVQLEVIDEPIIESIDTDEEVSEEISESALDFDITTEDSLTDSIEVQDNAFSLDDSSLELEDTSSATDEHVNEITLDEITLDNDITTEDNLTASLEVQDDAFSLDDFSLELEDAASAPDEHVNEITLDEITLDNDIDSESEILIEESAVAESNEEDSIGIEPVSEEPVISTPVTEVNTDIPSTPSLLDDTIDDEIIEIFMEEAEEAFGTISELLPAWIANTNDDEPLKEIRRAYHTLKGSGRLVGAADLGEFAWSFENMLNRVLDNTIKATPELLELMEQGKQTLPELFELFKTSGKPGENILVLMKHADALSEGKSIELDKPASSTDTEAALATQEDEPVEVTLEEELVEELPPINIDPVLLDIYRKEVSTHVETLKQYIKSWNEGETEAKQSLLRALHTLTGSSRTTGVETLAAVCSSFEGYVKHLQAIEADFPQVALVQLNETISLIERTVDCLDKLGVTLPSSDALLIRINSLPRDLPPAEKETAAPAEISNVEIEAPTESIVVEDEAPAEDIPVADYDEELLEIFLEEGTEILDESDQVIQDWVSNPEDTKFVEELQRQLHTLKGGARMAGITELGDLGHSVESLLTAVVDGHMKPSKPMFDLVQRSQDRLAKMLELVQDHKGLAAAKDLINEVDTMLENRGVVDDFDTPEVVAPEFTAPIQEPVAEDVVDTSVNDKEIEIEAATPSITSLEIPELEKLEEELRMEVDGANTASSEADLSLSEVEELELPEPPEQVESVAASDSDNTNVISLEPEKEHESELVAEHVEPNLPTEEGDRRKKGRVQAEQVRVRADLLDNLVNFAGEVSIYRSRLEQQTNNFRYNITEFDETVNRLREQLRQFEIETETQIEYRHEETLSNAQADFDPLEMDRFTTMQHLSRAMMESLGDLDSLRGILNNLTRESETLLLQQSRVNTDLQEGLMRTRMVPFSGQAARIRRIVRQTCGELGKHAELHLEGMDAELDRTVLERIISPIEHMLRNAVAHGIEKPEERKNSGKPETGNIHFSISNEGSEILIKIKDDGAGINLDAIRTKAISKGLLTENEPASKEKLLEMIMQSGFSTAESVNQIAGRGVGMDVVNTEIKQLGGVFNIDTEKNNGTTFTVTLPLTLAITRALMVMVGEDTYSVPLLSVEGVERVHVSKVKEIMASEDKLYNWVGEDYQFMHLGTVMGINEIKLNDDEQQLPMLMVKTGNYRAAILVDALLGSREIVVKSVGPQLSTLRGISGATVMGDGSVVLIIDLAMLIRLAATSDNYEVEKPVTISTDEVEDTAPLVMIVDDSITVRKVTTRLLERHEMRVVAAKDGVDALAQLQETIPDIMLLDVEMPRMDGFELATNMRGDDRLKNIPIIMITSRTGQKHRDRASSIGVNIYMGKPYTETDLLDNINVLTGRDL